MPTDPRPAFEIEPIPPSACIFIECRCSICGGTGITENLHGIEVTCLQCEGKKVRYKKITLYDLATYIVGLIADGK